MKRDFSTMRKILLDARENEKGSFCFGNGITTTTNEAEAVAHADLLCDAGLLQKLPGTYYRITNNGHDLIAAIEDDETWEEIKEDTGHLTFGDLVEYALELLRDPARRQQ